MADQLTSGQFALLTRMSRKALRHYDEIGLLRPAHVDPASSYRYYGSAQLEDARRINIMRSLGMPLAAIQATLRDWLGPDFALHLQQQRDALRRQATQTGQALKLVEQLLAAPPRPYPVSVKQIGPLPYLGLRHNCLPDDACDFIADAERQLRAVLDSALMTASGPVLAVYHESDNDNLWDVEVCLPVYEEPDAALPDSIHLGTLPGGEVASTVHEGDYGGTHGMQGAFTALWHWMQTSGNIQAAPPYEVYLLDGRNVARPQDYRTEIVWPLRS